MTIKQPKVSLKGILIPSNWDENGNIISLKIASSDEKEYCVEYQDINSSLIPYLRKEIIVNGILEQRGAIAFIHVQDVISQM